MVTPFISFHVVDVLIELRLVDAGMEIVTKALSEAVVVRLTVVTLDVALTAKA
jgi:hypothetical protein